MRRKHAWLAILPPIFIIVLFAFGYLLAPNDPEFVDMSIRFLDPCVQYPLGTDNMGRCVLSRLLYGGRITLGIVLAGSMMVTGLGTVLGLLLGGSRRGKSVVLESVITAITAIPPIAYLIIFIAAWGNSIFTMLVAITVSLMLRLLKLVKTRTEVEMHRAYVLCAIASGASQVHILFVHILPNLIWDVIHFVCMSCADMVLSIVGFSFIGLDLGDDVIDLGTMVSETHHYIIAHPALTWYPILVILLCTASFHFLGRWVERRAEPYA